MFDPSYQNVFFTLFFGLLTIWAMQAAKKNILLKIIAVIVGASLAMFSSSDYGAFAVLMIVLLYCLRDKKVLQNVFGALFISWGIVSIFVFFILPFYNGERGIRMKYFFYAFYPAHILILYLITRLL